jgi:hypothetical protein
MSGDYSSWSLEYLKSAIEGSDISWLESSAKYYQRGGQACLHAAEDFMAQVNSLGEAWRGSAASAAVQDAHNTHQVLNHMHQASTASSQASTAYYQEAKADQARSRSIPNVDNSWGHAVTSGGWGGLVGIGGAKLIQQHKYDQAHTQAVQLAEKMDKAGSAQASQIRGQSWPDGPASASAPPSSLPPVPGSSGRSGSIGGSYDVAPRGGGPGGAYSPIVGGPSTSQSDSEIMNNGVKGTGKGDPAHTTGTSPQGGGPKSPDIPSTTPQSGGNPQLTPGGTPTEAVSPTPGVGGGGGAAAAALGGAGLLGAGALGSRGLLGGAGRGGAIAEGEGARGRAGGLAEGEGARGRFGGLGEGEGLSGRTGGLADGEGLRGSARGMTGVPEDDLGAGRRGMLRAGAPDGFLGEPVAGEAGRLGGYPGGGAGARRRDDDEEAPVPDYLVETEDVWGDGVTAAPPVIGE